MTILVFYVLFLVSCEKESQVIVSFNLDYEVKSDPFLQKDGLKILDIGNSYTDDATDLLPVLVKSAKVDLSGMCLYKVTRGGASFKNWCDIYSDNDGNSTYYVSKVVGGFDADVPTGKGTGKDGELFRKLLSEVKWDLVIIHQRSNYAPYYDMWNSEGEGGYLDELLSIIKDNQSEAKIGFLLVHSYSSDYEGNTEHSSLLRWELISESVNKLSSDYDIDYVIPYGTAVQNLRASSFNNEYDLCRDGKHCAYGLSQYTAACCYYETLIAPRTGVSVLGNPSRYNAPNTSAHSSIDVTQYNAPYAQAAAVMACMDMHTCSNPDTVVKIVEK